jgi:quinol monooxygenase YgiN
MIRLSAELVASECEARQVADALQRLMISTRLERGCLGCTVRIETAGRHTVFYEEHWETEADVQRRVESGGFTAVLELMERAEAPPRIEFDLVRAVRGLDYVQEVRSPGRPPL